MTKRATILAIDASTDACSVALQVGDKKYHRFEMAARSHTQRVLPLVDEVLTEANVELADLDAIAYGAGPGSFTGLRICLGFVQGLAFSANLPVIQVSTLAMLALQAAHRFNVSDISIAQDARMGEIYAARWKLVDGNPVAVDADALLTPQAFDASADSELFIGTGLSLLDEEQLKLIEARAQHEELWPNALDALDIAQVHWNRGETIAASDAEPVYLRNEVSWQKRVKKVDRFNQQ